MDDFNATPMDDKSASESSDEEQKDKKGEAATGEADLGTDTTTSKKEE